MSNTKVFFRGNLIEIPDLSVTLGQILDAFGEPEGVLYEKIGDELEDDETMLASLVGSRPLVTMTDEPLPRECNYQLITPQDVIPSASGGLSGAAVGGGDDEQSIVQRLMAMGASNFLQDTSSFDTSPYAFPTGPARSSSVLPVVHAAGMYDPYAAAQFGRGVEGMAKKWAASKQPYRPVHSAYSVQPPPDSYDGPPLFGDEQVLLDAMKSAVVSADVRRTVPVKSEQ